MKNVGLFEAKQKLSELVERAEEGERIGITRRGKLAAVLVPAATAGSVEAVFEKIDEIRKRARRRKGVSSRTLVDEGRI
jgi:prevent-host-death family protein